MLVGENLEEMVTQTLKKYDDLEVIVLKGHLVLEQYTACIIASSSLDEKRVKKMNLKQFSHKLDLLGVLPNILNEEDYQSLRELNRIRNRMAHELFCTAYLEDILKWASGILGATPKTINRYQTQKNYVIKALCFLAGKLSGTSRALRLFFLRKRRRVGRLWCF